MGQQQLLLIVLGVIIVGVAIVVGINLFNANSEQATKDTVVAEATNIAALAQQYYKKPQAMGGGGNTFTGFTIPPGLVSSTTASYTATVAAQAVTITADPNDALGYGWTATTTITSTSIRTNPF